MALALYAATAAALLWTVHRWVLPLQRAAATLLFLLPFAFTGHALLAGRVYAPVDHLYDEIPISDLKARYGVPRSHNIAVVDVYSQMIPWRHVVRESWRRGDWPLWNPFMFPGDILAAAAQPAPYSPFTLLACLLPAALSFTFTGAITFFVAALSMYLFLRAVECSPYAAVFGAAAWMCSTAVVLHVLWPVGLCSAMFPFVLFATHRVVREPGVASGVWLLVALTLIILAGHPESIVHAVLLGGAYGLFEMWGARATALRALGIATVAGIASLLLCAVYLLPFIEAIPQSNSYLYRQFFADVQRGASGPDILARLLTHAFPFLHIRDWIEPKISDLKSETAIVGSIVLAFAVYGAWRVRTRLAMFLVVMIVLSILAHTEWAPVTRVQQLIPLLNWTLAERFAFTAAIGLAALAAFGIDRFRSTNEWRSVALLLIATLTVLAAGTWWIPRTFALSSGPVDWGEYKIPAELLGIGIGAIIVILFRKTPASAVIPLVLLVLVQRAVSDAGMWGSFPARVAYPPVPLFEPMAKATEPFRIVGKGAALVPSTAALYGLEDVRGYDAMTLDVLNRTFDLWCVGDPVWFNRVHDLSRPFLSLMNVRYAIALRTDTVPPRWRVVGHYGQSALLENLDVIPRAFVPTNVRYTKNDDLTVQEMSQQKDFREWAWISAERREDRLPNGPGVVRVRARPSFGEYVLDADMNGTGWVVLSESAWKGWRVKVDGHPAQLRRANMTFLATFVPAGKHEIRFEYKPSSFLLGLAISATTVLALIVAAYFSSRR